VICLTGLTRSVGDVLLFYVIPTEQSNTTFFQFFFEQKPTFDCDTCITTSPQYLLSADSFNMTTVGNCSDRLNLSFSVSGCSTGVDNNKDLYKYIIKDSNVSKISYSGYGPNGLINYSTELQGVPVTTSTIDQPVQLGCESSINLYGSGLNIFTDIYDWGAINLAATEIMASWCTIKSLSLNNFVEDEFAWRDTSIRVGWRRNDATVGGFPEGYDNIQMCANYQGLLYQQFIQLQQDHPNWQDPTHPDYFVGVYLTIPYVYGRSEEVTYPQNGYCCPETLGCDGLTLFANSYTTYFGTLGGTEIFANSVPSVFGESQIYLIALRQRMWRNPQDKITYTNYVLNNFPCATQALIGDGSPDLVGSVTWQMEQQFIASCNQPTVGRWDNPEFPANFAFFDGILPVPQIRGAAYNRSLLELGSLGLTATTFDSISIKKYQMNTYPSTGTTQPFHSPQTLIPNLSATTCISLTGLTFNPYSGETIENLSSYDRYLFLYRFAITDPQQQTYDIYTLPRQSNGTLSQTPLLIGTGTGSTVTVLNPTYFTP
jgi:hypothetical protein